MHSHVLSLWRMRGYTLSAAFLLLLGLCIALLPSDLHPVPGRLGAYSRLWPLLLSFVSLPLIIIHSRRHVTPRSYDPYAFRHFVEDLLFSSLCSLACCSVASCGSPSFLDVSYTFAFYTLLTALFLNIFPTLSWLPPFCIAIIVWLLGTDGYGSAKSWALTLPGSSPHLRIVVLVLLLLTLALSRFFSYEHSALPFSRQHEAQL